ncbi:MAG: YihY/virulence factor BrkB family protein [Spirochaetes bacterium]|nr:YihY/virulence factor BrkB family protein [Spirochaetota bacterium]
MRKKILMKLVSWLFFLKNILVRFTARAFRFFVDDLKRALQNFEHHNGELTTCAMAFFLLISFIPVSLVIISALSFWYLSEDIAAKIYFSQIKNLLPSIQMDKLIASIDKIVYQKRYLAFVWIPFLFWWGSLVFDIVERALEFAFRIGQGRKYWKAKIRHFIIIIAISLTAVLLTLFSNLIAIVKNELVFNFLEKNFKNISIFGTNLESIVETPFVVSSLFTLSINTILIFLLYKFVPPKKLDNTSMFKGALFAALSYEIIKLLFSYYITEINDYTSIFGSLNAIVILMIWIWYTCFLFVFGAEMAWIFYENKTQSKQLS